jgi:3-oxoacyl-[acyl-carrier protein] reductase
MAAIPLGSKIDPEDVGQAALYLASSAAKNITGTSLAVDGGNSAGTMDVYQDKKSAL